MTFSERQGLKAIRQVLQTNSMDPELRSRLWNVLREQCLYVSEPYLFSDRGNANLLRRCRTLWHDYFKRPTDTIPQYPNEAIGEIRKYFFNCEWYEVYDLIEFIANRSIYTSPSSAMTGFNEVLASELSAYKFVGASSRLFQRSRKG